MTISYRIDPAKCVTGEITVPGDKSISHRAIIFGSIAKGVSQVRGFLEGEDCLATMRAFQQLGVVIEHPAQSQLVIHGVGLHGLRAPDEALDVGNSGTSMRLLTGLLAGQPFASRLIGDASLMKRPMGRVSKPLAEMGANVAISSHGTPPVEITAVDQLRPIRYSMPVASAQVKSAILLAGLYANGETTVIESAPTRDHTERMLASFGAQITTSFPTVSVRPGELKACDLTVPGDLSSAAFYIVAACIGQGSELTIKGVGMNPTRTGVIEILRQMGASISVQNARMAGYEPVADLHIVSSELKGIEVPVDLIPSAIDEFPVLCVAAACAQGVTTFRKASELRVKESDRIHSVASGLSTLGIKIQEFEDGLSIHGGAIGGGEIDSFDDHRIAMAFAMASLRASQPIEISNCDNVATSFPGFVRLAESVGVSIAEID